MIPPNFNVRVLFGDGQDLIAGGAFHGPRFHHRIRLAQGLIVDPEKERGQDAHGGGDQHEPTDDPQRCADSAGTVIWKGAACATIGHRVWGFRRLVA